MRSLVRALASTAAGRKDALPPGIDAGWSGGSLMNLLPARYRPGPARIKQLLNTYGGTSDSVVWVYACVDRIADRIAGTEWDLRTDDDQVIDHPDAMLLELLTVPKRQPKPRMTWFDFAYYLAMDLEIAGNTYWLKDRRNAYGMPESLRRLRPEYTQIAVNDAGEVIGYVLRVGAIQVPYDAEEVAHLRYPNPLDEHYGMGTVEALLREVEADLALTDHVTGFFESGGRIDGVLTTSDTLTEPQWQRLVHQFNNELDEVSQRRLKALVVEKGTDFKPISSVPRELGVVELADLGKDRTLSGFGVPAPVLGGRMENANYKMEDAQHIFLQTLTPKCRRIGEGLTAEVMEPVAPWAQANLKLHPSASEPKSVRIERGKGMLGAGASINESRDEMGLALIDDPTADQIVLPTNMLPVGVTAPRKAAQLVARRPGAIAGRARELTAAVKAIEAPVLPDGFEQRGDDVKVPEGADEVVVQRVLDDQAAFLRTGYDVLRPAFVRFFHEQRNRVLNRLEEFRRATREERKEKVTPGKLWPAAVENAALREHYLALVDRLGARALETPRALVGTEINWNLQHPHIAAARERIAEKVVRINDTTRQAIAHQVEVGMTRGYTIYQLANGVAADDFPGIAGVFDDATAARAETIARTESGMVYNAATAAGYRDGGVEKVYVIDGIGDALCAEANGATWSLEDAESDPLGHPNCVRAFAPVLAGDPDTGD